MRVPKVGEKWKRWDGKPNNITVIQVHQDLNPAATKVRYRYDDGVDSEKFLPDFHKKFRDPEEERCDQRHPPTGLRCLGMVRHTGDHTNGMHQWSTAKYAPETKVVLERLPAVQKRLENAKQIYADNYRAHCKSYYGYDPAESNAFEQRQGNWDDPDYRAKYMGFKK